MQLIRIMKKKTDIHKQGKKYGNLGEVFQKLVLWLIISSSTIIFSVKKNTFRIMNWEEIDLDIFQLAVK